MDPADLDYDVGNSAAMIEFGGVFLPGIAASLLDSSHYTECIASSGVT